MIPKKSVKVFTLTIKHLRKLNNNVTIKMDIFIKAFDTNDIFYQNIFNLCRLY